MTKSLHLAMDGILLAFSILPVLVNGYDCSSISSKSACSSRNGLNDYSQCMLTTYSISVFIQCASQRNPPKFTANTDSAGGTQDISAADVLYYGLTTNARLPLPGCDVPLATNLPKATREHGSVNFGEYLCSQYQPLNSGLCGLRYCLLALPAAPEEHSIESYCAGDVQDLTKARTLPDTCGGDPNSAAPSAAASSSAAAASSSQTTTRRSTSSPKSSSSSIVSTTSLITSSATTPSRTTASPTPQAPQPTGAASRRWGTGFVHLNRLSLAVLPIIAVF